MIDGVCIPPFHLMLQYSVSDIIHLSHWDFSPTPSTLLWILDSWSLWASSMGPLALWPPVGRASGTHQQESGGWDETEVISLPDSHKRLTASSCPGPQYLSGGSLHIAVYSGLWQPPSHAPWAPGGGNSPWGSGGSLVAFAKHLPQLCK